MQPHMGAKEPPTQDEAAIRAAVAQAVRRVDSPEAAEAVVQRIERLAAGETEASAGEHAAAEAGSAAADIVQAGHTGSATRDVAAVLGETAAQAVAPTPEAEETLEAAREVLQPAAEVGPRTSRGRSLLRDAVLHRMGPLEALDARLFLLVNGAPHPRWLDRLADLVSVATTGGWIWLIAVWLAGRLGLRGTRPVVRAWLPAVAGATFLVEHPIKAYVRRRRPFIHIVRALVVGKRPGSWSFPSGHTAASFASAWMLSRFWPRRAPVFFGLAALVGLSRTYVGVHYPGDVLSGAALGTVLAEAIRRVVGALNR